MRMLASSRQEDSEDVRPPSGKENMNGRTFLKSSEILCPVSTSSAFAIAEQPELRAYKLGKQKCSYNQVELVIKDVTGGKTSELKVSEAIETCVGSEVDEQLRESCLRFNVRFVNNTRMHLYIYVVYASPYGTTRSDKHTVMYHWMPVTRSKCRKGCTGSVIRGLQRFGRMPRRGAGALEGEDSWKEPRHLYIAIDEASTHVCPRHETSKFRLLVAAFDDKNQLLGTTVSSSIRVLANNDAPLGAASFKLHCYIKGGGTGPTLSPLRSSRSIQPGGQMNQAAQCSRIPLQALPPNTSPLRSNTATTEETTETISLPLTSDRRRAGENQIVETTPQKRGAASEDIHGQKEHSVTQLTERILEVCAVKSSEAVISLRALATVLSMNRRRIGEIFDVLQSVQVVQQLEKEKYIWLGSSAISDGLTNLAKEALIHASGEPILQSADSGPGPIRSIKNSSQYSAGLGDPTLDSLMCTLSRRLIKLFLVDVASPVYWEQALTTLLDNPQKDPEEFRCKGRKLSEIVRILTSLQLVSTTIPQNVQYAATAYKWLGAEAVIEHLDSLSAKRNAGSTTHYLRSKSSSLRRHRGSTTELGRGRDSTQTHDDTFVRCSPQMEVLRTSDNPSDSQNQIPRRSRRKFSDIHGKDESPFSAQLPGCHHQALTNAVTSIPYIPKRPRLALATSQVTVNPSTIQESFKSSAVIDDAHVLHRSSLSECIQGQFSCQLQASITELSQNPDGQKREGLHKHLVDDKASKNAPCIAERNCYGGLQDISLSLTEPEYDAPNTNKGLPTATNERECPTGISKCNQAAQHADITKTADNASESPDGNTSEEGAAAITELELKNTCDLSYQCAQGGPSVFQFPYKKRPHNWSSFLALAAPGCCEDPFSLKCAQRDFLLDENEQNQLPYFNPFYYLQQLFTHQQVAQFESQNPAFLFQYVHYSRILYHSLCAQAMRNGATLDQDLVRPVAEHGSVDVASNLCSPQTEQGPSPSSALTPEPHTLHQLLSPFTEGGLWLKKDWKRQREPDLTSCQSPNSTNYQVDHPRIAGLSETAPIASQLEWRSPIDSCWTQLDLSDSLQKIKGVQHTSFPSAFDLSSFTRC